MRIKFLPLLLSALPLTAYDLHEWGTFTTVSGSDGSYLTGLHVEEEVLPHFVYSHAGMGNFKRGMAMLPTNTGQYEVSLGVKDNLYHFGREGNPMPNKGFGPARKIINATVKMETPVIYFYNGAGEKVNVKVGFNGGTISQWYPNRMKGDTPGKIDLRPEQKGDYLKSFKLDESEISYIDTTHALDFGKGYNGSIEWEVELLERDNAYTFKPTQSPTWIYPKVSDADMVKVGEEYEDYLFYRGIGNFPLPATFSVNEEDVVQVKNHSEEEIPFAFAFENTGKEIRYKTLGGISEVAEVSETDWTVAGKNWQVEVFSEMRAGLISQGLTTEESDGMVKTWWKSYFQQQGLRVFWVVPEKELEKILPLSVTPAPESSVRVIVGRSDILRPSFEQKLVNAIGKKEYEQYARDRFHAAYKNRLEALIKEPVFQHISKDELENTPLLIKGIKGGKELVLTTTLRKGQEVNLGELGHFYGWKVKEESELFLDDLRFSLDKETGVMTAYADKENAAHRWDRYEIQLKRYLN